MPVVRIPVESSSIGAVGYTPDERVMEVTFLRGAVYRYLDVPEAVFASFIVASSKGRYFNTHVKNRYTYCRE